MAVPRPSDRDAALEPESQAGALTRTAARSTLSPPSLRRAAGTAAQ
jgi:hypothetical protein